MFHVFVETMLFMILAIKTIKNVIQITLAGLIFIKEVVCNGFKTVSKFLFLTHYFLY
jgi:hypothetical protein